MVELKISNYSASRAGLLLLFVHFPLSDGRGNAVELLLYCSARTFALEKNIGIFYPHVFIDKQLLQEPLNWNCYADKTVVK